MGEEGRLLLYFHLLWSATYYRWKEGEATLPLEGFSDAPMLRKSKNASNGHFKPFNYNF